MQSFNLRSFILVAALIAPPLSLPVSAVAQDGGIASLFGQKSSQKFLPVHEAFGVSIDIQGNELIATFKVTPKHYLYKDKIGLSLPDGMSMDGWRFSRQTSMIDDPDFGRVAVFEGDFTARTTLSSTKAINESASLHWQGCAKAGLCYPPEITKFNVDLLPIKPAKNSTVESKSISKQSDKKVSEAEKSTKDIAHNIVTPILNQETPKTQNSQNIIDNTINQEMDGRSDGVPNGDGKDIGSSTDVVVHDLGPVQLDHTVAIDDPFGINKRPLLAVVLLFLAGLLLSFTPCVYPMIPIVANIVARQNTMSSKKGFALSAAYGVGVASAYGLLGALIAWLGQAFIGYLQNPVVLIGFAILFALLALYMFDALKFQLPSSIKDKLQAKSQAADSKLGNIGGSFMAGLLSALVVSPCVSAPMAGALAAVSVSGSILFGFVALFALGLGLSVPLMVIGTAQGKFMPKAGVWMMYVKEFCGLLLFAVSLALLERVLLTSTILVLWAMWFTVVAVWLWRLQRLVAQSLAIMAVIWSACLLIGAAMGQKDTWQPLAKLSVVNGGKQVVHNDIHITTLAQLDEVLKTHDSVLVDVTADWCVECRIMEREVFTNRSQALLDVQVVKLDITNTTDDSRAVLARYGLMGPPALLLYKQGKLMNALLGEVNKQDLDQALLKL